jgi:bifunctional DNA-binding transcriptional regulator/antitoxin component of YhaV-PrlF toxin-antitoxin module
MRRIKITSKRQATLPAALCEELGVGPGDALELERRVLSGELLWVLRAAKPDWSWFGGASGYSKSRSHWWADIEESIARGTADETDRS